MRVLDFGWGNVFTLTLFHQWRRDLRDALVALTESLGSSDWSNSMVSNGGPVLFKSQIISSTARYAKYVSVHKLYCSRPYIRHLPTPPFALTIATAKSKHFKFSSAHIMPTLHLIIFSSIPMVPRFAHWGFFLPYEEGGTEGVIHHVKKRSFISNTTEYAAADLTPSISYTSCTPLPEIIIKNHELSEICYRVSDGRPFHLLSRNCQHWVFEVIQAIATKFNIAAVGDTVINRIKDMR